MLPWQDVRHSSRIAFFAVNVLTIILWKQAADISSRTADISAASLLGSNLLQSCPKIAHNTCERGTLEALYDETLARIFLILYQGPQGPIVYTDLTENTQMYWANLWTSMDLRHSRQPQTQYCG